MRIKARLCCLKVKVSSSAPLVVPMMLVNQPGAAMFHVLLKSFSVGRPNLPPGSCTHYHKTPQTFSQSHKRVSQVTHFYKLPKTAQNTQVVRE
jgi:hypothetical protein